MPSLQYGGTCLIWSLCTGWEYWVVQRCCLANSAMRFCHIFQLCSPKCLKKNFFFFFFWGWPPLWLTHTCDYVIITAMKRFHYIHLQQRLFCFPFNLSIQAVCVYTRVGCSEKQSFGFFFQHTLESSFLFFGGNFVLLYFWWACICRIMFLFSCCAHLILFFVFFNCAVSRG